MTTDPNSDFHGHAEIKTPDGTAFFIDIRDTIDPYPGWFVQIVSYPASDKETRFYQELKVQRRPLGNDYSARILEDWEREFFGEVPLADEASDD